jgi:methylated-DNA-[protein]-cysteine S-methyltransferase
MIFYAQAQSTLGPILLSTDGSSLTGLYFVGQRDCPVLDGLPEPTPEARHPALGMMDGVPIRKFKAYKRESGELFQHSVKAADLLAERAKLSESDCITLMQGDTPASALALFNQADSELREYFAGQRRVFELPLRPVGTPFQEQVWDALLRIPYGEVVSYGDVAREAGLSARYSRPVGSAVGSNPITIIIPCHRVVSSTRSLTGYGGGLERKYALLELEGFVLQ